MIKLQVIGNIVKDAVKNEVNGKSVINFTVAHTSKYKDQEKTSYVECSYWTERTGILPYLTKGVKIFTEGVPEVRQYTTKTGQTGSNLALFVSLVELCGGNKKVENKGISDANRIKDEDLPF